MKKKKLKSEHLLLSLYITIGFIISQFFNIYAYGSRGGTKLLTWFKTWGIYDKEPSLLLVSILCLILSVVIFFSFRSFLKKADGKKGEWILKVGFMMSLLFCFLSQVIFSSVMRLVYELSFCMVLILSSVIKNIFLQKKTDLIDEYKELWDLLKFFLPLTLGFPILVGGSGFITSFYQDQLDSIRLQLYRHITMSLYFVIGAFAYINYPILKRILLLRDKNES